MPILTLTTEELRTLHTILGVAMEKATDMYTMAAVTEVTTHIADSIRKFEVEGNHDYNSPTTDFDLTPMDLLHITALYNQIFDTLTLPPYYHNIMVATTHKIRDLAYNELGAMPLN